MLDAKQEVPRDGELRRLGVLAALGWIDPTAQEILQRHAAEVDLAQTILGPPGFDYSFAQFRAAEPELSRAARLLAGAGCEVIIQVGPAFAYQIGETPAGARSLAGRLTAECGIPVILNGVAVIDRLEAAGARRVAMACPYYDSAWKDEIRAFLERAGYEVLTMQSLLDQGVYETQAQIDARHWAFPEEELITNVRMTRAAAPDAQAILIGGAGARTLNWISRIQEDLGVPLVSADHALYCAFVEFAGLARRA